MELCCTEIYKSFGAGNVLNGVNFHIKGGEICAFLGENGAGKSTLMNIIGGILPATSGTVTIDGKKTDFHSPADAQKNGIAFIHQELNLINDLTVYENMFMPDFIKKGLLLDKAEMIRRTLQIFEKFGLDIDPEIKLGELDASYKQTVAIAKALRTEASLIIMDEPTSSLTVSETKHLFGIMKSLKEKGIALIFISHKLDEVMQICDRYTVIRDGVVVSDGKVCDVTADEIAEHMVGHKVVSHKAHVSSGNSDVVLQLENVSDGIHFNGVSLSVRKGEILGVTGLLGDGRSELFSSIFGISGGKYTGTVTVEGKQIHPKSPEEALRYGIAYLPRDRQENSIIPDGTCSENMILSTLKKFSRYGIMDKKRQNEAFSRQSDNLHIKSRFCPDGSITSLSGGNQQKVILAKWLLTTPKVLILDNPTQGVDVGAKEEIYSTIEKLAADGMSIIVLSAEAAEIMRMCEKCTVMYHGNTAATLTKTEINESAIMSYATGARKE